MITSHLLGGIGNNMFQIATSYSLALDNNDELIYNILNAENGHRPLKFYLGNILRNIKFVQSKLYYKHVYKEPFFYYMSIKYIPNIKLWGFFQSEKYFVHNKSKIIKLFSIDDQSRDYIEKKYGDILSNNTCSIHIRRGDYLNASYLYMCDVDYYKNAIRSIGLDNKFLVFSDDINWCRNVFNDRDYIFIE